MKGTKKKAEPEDFKRIARELLSTSEQFENPRSRKQDVLKSLAMMSALEDLARASLPSPAVPAPPESQPNPAHAATVPAPKVTPQKETHYRCSNPGYTQALQDPSLLQALLGLSAQAKTPPVANRVQAAAAAAAAKTLAPAPKPAEPEEKSPPSPTDFRMSRLSHVTAVPKVGPIHRSQPTRRCAVLKPTS